MTGLGFASYSYKELFMPEGPSIVILKELVQKYKGKKILSVTGNTKTIDTALLVGQKLVDFKSWGKHFLLSLPGQTVKIHFMLFGSYSIDEPTKPNPRLCLQFARGALYFYACSVRLLEGTPDQVYDWSADVMNEAWNPGKALVRKIGGTVLMRRTGGSGRQVATYCRRRNRLRPTRPSYR
jgi:endonuclease-8